MAPWCSSITISTILALLVAIAGCAHCPFPELRKIQPDEVQVTIQAERPTVREDQHIRLIVEQRNLSVRALIFDWYTDDHVTIEQCGSGVTTESYFPGNRGFIVTDSHQHIFKTSADRNVGPGTALIDTLPIAFLPPGRYHFTVHIHRLTSAATIDAACDDTICVEPLSCGEVTAKIGHDDKLLESLLFQMAGIDRGECSRLLSCINTSDTTWLASESRQYLKGFIIDKMKVK